jgi:hypothetical protein
MVQAAYDILHTAQLQYASMQTFEWLKTAILLEQYNVLCLSIPG